MGWTSDEPEVSKKGMETSSKILLAIIACLILIIVLIMVLLLNIQQTTFTISVDGKATTVNKEILLANVDDITYVNIEEFSKLVGYEYHKGEYKSFTIEEDKCYVQGKNETATFYLNDNKVCKLPVNKITEDYSVYNTENTVKEINNKIYASLDAIKIAFNVLAAENANSLSIYTLDTLVSSYNTKMSEWGYSDITDQSFENKKAILYDYIIVKKENGLYKIINTDNTKEIVSDKYEAIEFVENTQEFFVTNSLGKVGIINLDGTTKIEPIYDSIEVLDKKSNLYLIQKDEKYGVVKSGNITIIYPEYDSIGIDNTTFKNVDSRYLLLDSLIPVNKNGKYGAFDKNGNLIYKVEYDGFGCNLTEVEIDGIKKSVNPVLTIEECQGIVIKKENKYGISDIKGKELVPLAVDNIYFIENEEREVEYFMLYNNKELNVIERLIKAGLMKKPDDTTSNKDNTTVNTISNNIQNNISNIANSAITTTN